MNTVLTNPDGTIPNLSTVKATSTGQYTFVGVDQATNRLMVQATIVEKSGTNPAATFAHGTKTVTTAGTPVQLSGTATAYLTVVLVPLRTNTGNAYAGSNSAATSQHVIVPWSLSAPPGEVIDLSQVYIDTDVNGEGVAWEALS